MRWFPNGLKTKHFKPSSSFGASPALINLGAFFDALVGRRRMDDLFVIQNKKILFGSDRTAAKGYLARQRQNAVQKFLKAWEGFAAVEGGAYKGKLRGQDCLYLAAYYNNRVKPISETDPETVITPGTYLKGYAYPEELQPSVD